MAATMFSLSSRQSCRGAKSATQRRIAGLRAPAPLPRRSRSLAIAPKALLGGGGEESGWRGARAARSPHPLLLPACYDGS